MTLKQLTPDLFVPENFEENHVYFADAEGKKKYTGVTTILGVLAKPALIPWASRMAVEYASARIASGTEYTEDELATIFTEAQGAHARKRDEGAQKGTDTHALVEEYVKAAILHDGYSPLYSDDKFVQILPFIKWANENKIKFISSEAPLVSKSLFVAGTADLIFEKDGKRYIGDIKTYKKIYDRVPFYQCAGYAMMYSEMNGIEDPINSKFYEGGIDGYCIINLPKEREFNESEDILWSFDTAGDTKAFLACVEIYRQNAQFKPSYYKKAKV